METKFQIKITIENDSDGKGRELNQVLGDNLSQIIQQWMINNYEDRCSYTEEFVRDISNHVIRFDVVNYESVSGDRTYSEVVFTEIPTDFP